MTSPSADRERFMALPSSIVNPDAPVFSKRSLPPRSMSQSLLTSSVAPLLLVVILVKQCDRLETSLTFVQDVERARRPLQYHWLAFLRSGIATLVRPSTSTAPLLVASMLILHAVLHSVGLKRGCLGANKSLRLPK
uniref:Uncharacterized protein n=1 Tax=Arundo donax TaxID=35708 RepID=A0A0A9CMB1_ARUDO